MGLHWTDFDEKFQESITMNIARLAPKMNDIDIGILTLSLTLIDCCKLIDFL